jgi:hypothetical protein
LPKRNLAARRIRAASGSLRHLELHRCAPLRISHEWLHPPPLSYTSGILIALSFDSPTGLVGPLALFSSTLSTPIALGSKTGEGYMETIEDCSISDAVFG